MAVSKALRYQILRRDNHTCRYCGGVAPDVTLTVDHVLAAALGGTDDPSNLVASCKDCNAGKAATSPDQALVDQVSEEAIRWAKAVRLAADQALQQFEEVKAARGQFKSAWDAWTYNQGKKRYNFPLPPSWMGSIDSMLTRGLPMELLLECVQITMSRPNVAADQRFKYFCGVAWRKVGEIDEQARSTFGIESSQGISRREELERYYSFSWLELADLLLEHFAFETDGVYQDYQSARSALWGSMESAYIDYLQVLDNGGSFDDAREKAEDTFRSAIAYDLHEIRQRHRPGATTGLSS